MTTKTRGRYSFRGCVCCELPVRVPAGPTLSRRSVLGGAAALGLGAAAVALTLALPAFRDTSEDWLKKQDLAVTFLDRSGAEVGRRGILHDDSVPIAQMPPYLIQAVLATEDRRSPTAVTWAQFVAAAGQ